jgi:hypothetical protein
MHLGTNTDGFAVGIDNVGTGETAGGLYVTAQGGKPVIEADIVESGQGVAVQGVSSCCENFGTGPGTGVQGLSGTGVGVEGIATLSGVGVAARSLTADGMALQVEGRSGFSTGGAGVVPAGLSSAFIADSAVTAESHISVTLVSNPGTRTLQWVERNPGNGFTVRLSSAPPTQRPQTRFTYLVTEPFLP